MGVSQRLVLLLKLGEETNILDGDDRLVGKGLEESDLPLSKELRIRAADGDNTDGGALFHHGDVEYRPPALTPCDHAALGKFVVLALRVSEVECPCLEHRPACDGPADDGKGGRRGDGAVMGNRDELVVFPLKDGGVVRVAQASGGLGHGVEYRLNVGRRARDHSQDLRSRRLLVQRLFRLVEQADILNGDDCLIGKGSHQLDLLLGKGLNLDSTDHDHADDSAFPEHRDGEDRAVHLILCPKILRPLVLGIGQDVVDVHGSALQDSPSRRRCSVLADRIPFRELEPLRRVPEAHCDAIEIRILPVDEALVRTAESHGILD